MYGGYLKKNCHHLIQGIAKKKTSQLAKQVSRWKIQSSTFPVFFSGDCQEELN